MRARMHHAWPDWIWCATGDATGISRISSAGNGEAAAIIAAQEAAGVAVWDISILLLYGMFFLNIFPTRSPLRCWGWSRPQHNHSSPHQIQLDPFDFGATCVCVYVCVRERENWASSTLFLPTLLPSRCWHSNSQKGSPDSIASTKTPTGSPSRPGTGISTIAPRRSSTGSIPPPAKNVFAGRRQSETTPPSRVNIDIPNDSPTEGSPTSKSSVGLYR